MRRFDHIELEGNQPASTALDANKLIVARPFAQQIGYKGVMVCEGYEGLAKRQ